MMIRLNIYVNVSLNVNVEKKYKCIFKIMKLGKSNIKVY